MSEREHILLAVTDDAASHRAGAYVARLAARSNAFEAHLCHRLPALPPELREHGGSECGWREEVRRQQRPVLEAMQTELLGSGMSPDTIHIVETWDASSNEHLAEALVRVARDEHCTTIALGREHLHGLEDLLHHHTSEELVRSGDGIVLWIVE